MSPTSKTIGKGVLKKSKHEEGPEIIILVRRDVFSTADPHHREIRREIEKETTVKYVYSSKVYRSQPVKEMIKQDKWGLTKARKIWINEKHLSNIKSGKPYNIKQIWKTGPGLDHEDMFGLW